jgi:4-hydroxy-tetrahydrodipicolinate synthase
MQQFGRVLTAMVTPFKKDMSVDYGMAEKLALHLIANGSDGLVLHGTTGESPTLTHEEEFELYRVVVKALKGLPAGRQGKAAVIAGSGSNSTATTIHSTKEAERIGVDGAMIVVPYYNRPPQEGLYQHFKAVADNTGLPLIIYNIPSRTGRNMEPETVARLAKIKNYAGIKEAAGDLEQVSKIRSLTPKEFLIWSGDDNMTIPIMERGGYGIISVISHVAGKLVKEMVEAQARGDKAKAAEINKKLEPLYKAAFITTNPIPIKAALEMVGFNCGKPRLPLIEANSDEKETIRKVLLELKLL